MRAMAVVFIPGLALALASMAQPLSAAEPGASRDGLVEVALPRMDVAYLMPGQKRN